MNAQEDKGKGRWRETYLQLVWSQDSAATDNCSCDGGIEMRGIGHERECFGCSTWNRLVIEHHFASLIVEEENSNFCQSRARISSVIHVL